MRKGFLSTFLLLALSCVTFAQATASATATTANHVVPPIAITKTVDVNFGNVAVIASGTVVLAPASTRTATGGVTLPSAAGTVTAASLTLQGSVPPTQLRPSTDYTITRVSGTETHELLTRSQVLLPVLVPYFPSANFKCRCHIECGCCTVSRNIHKCCRFSCNSKL